MYECNYISNIRYTDILVVTKLLAIVLKKCNNKRPKSKMAEKKWLNLTGSEIHQTMPGCSCAVIDYTPLLAGKKKDKSVREWSVFPIIIVNIVSVATLRLIFHSRKYYRLICCISTFTFHFGRKKKMLEQDSHKSGRKLHGVL